MYDMDMILLQTFVQMLTSLESSTKLLTLIPAMVGLSVFGYINIYKKGNALLVASASMSMLAITFSSIIGNYAVALYCICGALGIILALWKGE